MAAKVRGILGFYVNRFSIIYAGTGAVNVVMIDGWLYLLKNDLLLSVPVAGLVAVLTSIFTDYVWKCEVVFRSPLLSRERFYKYFLNGSAATIIQYVLFNLFSQVVLYLVAYPVAVAIGFLFAYTISRKRIWNQYIPRSPQPG